MRTILAKLSRTVLYSLALISLPSLTMSGQVFPPFTTPTQQSNVQMDAGVSAAQVPNGMYGTALVSVYSQDGLLYYSVSADGTNSAYAGGVVYTIPGGTTGNYADVDCNAGYPGNCGATIATYGGYTYIAFPDANTGGLDVLQATYAPGSIGYSFSLVHQDNTVYLTTVPSMINAFGDLIIIFGAKEPYKNAFYSVNYNGTTWPTATDYYLGEGPDGGGSVEIASGAQPGLALLGSTLWMTSQQNNSSKYMYVYSSTDGINWTPNANVGVGGKSPTLAIGSGISMITVNNTLVLANKQDSSANGLYIFSSPDGTNWSAEDYGPTNSLYISNTPAIALFNNDVALQYRSNTSAYMESELVAQ